ncbi:hypothetical protein [Pseudoalteromonas byunsanensis]|nr:hypothetical protein [Pseudoalteromonas byunsanensis]
MKSKQSGVKFSIILFSVIILGVSAWFTKAQANELPKHDKSVVHANA